MNKISHLNKETIENFNNNYIYEDLYNVDRFHIIKELGYPNISIVIENNIDLKKRFIEHFFLNIIDNELNDYLENWNDFNHYWSIGTYDKNIIFKISKQLKCNLHP